MTHPLPPHLTRWVEFMAANPSPVDVVAGRDYAVPCALTPIPWRGITTRVALIGTPHEDRDLVGFNPWHVHVDVRFLPVEDWQSLQLISAIIPLSGRDDDRPTAWASSELQVLQLPAMRQAAPEWPAHEAPFQAAMEAAHQGYQPRQGRCPHRGIDLRCGRRVGNGARQCPGHGLWWAEDGSLVQRAGGGR